MAGVVGWNPTLHLVFLVVLNDFSDDEIQEILGEFRVQIGLMGQFFKPCNLRRFAVGIGRGKVMFGLELTYGLSVLEAFPKRIHKDRIQTVDAFAVLFQQCGGAGDGVVSQWAFPSA